MTAPAPSATEVWKRRLSDLGSFLNILQPMRIQEVQDGEAKIAWKNDVRRHLTALSTEDLDSVSALWIARLEESEATRVSVNSRANNLLLFVGVLTTGAALVARTLESADSSWALATIVVGALLLWGALSTAVLAVRAQRVGVWDSPWIDIGELQNSKSLRVERVVQLYVAAHQNKNRLRGPVGLLAHAQSYALVSLFLVASLAILSVLAPPSSAEPQSEPPPATIQASPVPTAQSTSTPTGLNIASPHAVQ